MQFATIVLQDLSQDEFLECYESYQNTHSIQAIPKENQIVADFAVNKVHVYGLYNQEPICSINLHKPLNGLLYGYIVPDSQSIFIYDSPFFSYTRFGEITARLPYATRFKTLVNFFTQGVLPSNFSLMHPVTEEALDYLEIPNMDVVLIKNSSSFDEPRLKIVPNNKPDQLTLDMFEPITETTPDDSKEVISFVF